MKLFSPFLFTSLIEKILDYGYNSTWNCIINFRRRWHSNGVLFIKHFNDMISNQLLEKSTSTNRLMISKGIESTQMSHYWILIQPNIEHQDQPKNSDSLHNRIELSFDPLENRIKIERNQCPSFLPMFLSFSYTTNWSLEPYCRRSTTDTNALDKPAPIRITRIVNFTLARSLVPKCLDLLYLLNTSTLSSTQKTR